MINYDFKEKLKKLKSKLKKNKIIYKNKTDKSLKNQKKLDYVIKKQFNLKKSKNLIKKKKNKIINLLDGKNILNFFNKWDINKSNDTINNKLNLTCSNKKFGIMKSYGILSKDNNKKTNTKIGWYLNEIKENDKNNLLIIFSKYFHKEINNNIPLKLIKNIPIEIKDKILSKDIGFYVSNIISNYIRKDLNNLNLMNFIIYKKKGIFFSWGENSLLISKNNNMNFNIIKLINNKNNFIDYFEINIEKNFDYIFIANDIIYNYYKPIEIFNFINSLIERKKRIIDLHNLNYIIIEILFKLFKSKINKNNINLILIFFRDFSITHKRVKTNNLL